MKRILCLVTLLFTLVGTCGVVAAPAGAQSRAAIEDTLLRLINRARADHGLHAVKIQAKLDAAAIAHSRQMLALDYFSHDSASGATSAQRLRAAGYTAAGYSSWSVGEVIGWGRGSAGSAKAVFKAWMASAGHRKVILCRRWRDAGVGCARGSFKGRAASLYTVDLGRRCL